MSCVQNPTRMSAGGRVQWSVTTDVEPLLTSVASLVSISRLLQSFRADLESVPRPAEVDAFARSLPKGIEWIGSDQNLEGSLLTSRLHLRVDDLRWLSLLRFPGADSGFRLLRSLKVRRAEGGLQLRADLVLFPSGAPSGPAGTAGPLGVGFAWEPDKPVLDHDADREEELPRGGVRLHWWRSADVQEPVVPVRVHLGAAQSDRHGEPFCDLGSFMGA